MGRPANPADREASGEIVALRLFQIADEAGQSITRIWIRAQVDALQAHPVDCRRCGGLCVAARQTSASAVYRVAQQWQHDIERTRKLARR